MSHWMSVALWGRDGTARVLSSNTVLSRAQMPFLVGKFLTNPAYARCAKALLRHRCMSAPHAREPPPGTACLAHGLFGQPAVLLLPRLTVVLLTDPSRRRIAQTTASAAAAVCSSKQPQPEQQGHHGARKQRGCPRRACLGAVVALDPGRCRNYLGFHACAASGVCTSAVA